MQFSFFSKTLLTLGALNMAFVVAFGAVGSHILSKKLSQPAFDTLQTALRYHSYHALGVILICALIAAGVGNSKLLQLSAASMLLGIAIFCSALYTLALSGVHVFGILTPVGGSLLILAWLILAFATISS